MIRFTKSFLRNESGATAIEYGLIAALLSIVIVGAASQIGGGVSLQFNTVATEVTKP